MLRKNIWRFNSGCSDESIFCCGIFTDGRNKVIWGHACKEYLKIYYICIYENIVCNKNIDDI